MSDLLKFLDADGNPKFVSATNPLPTSGGGGGGGGTGDASAANQTSQIAVETAIRDRLISGGPEVGSGAVTAKTQRVTLATDGPGVANLSAIAASTAAIDADLGSDGTGAPAFSGGATGVRGWLRRVSETLIALALQLPASLGVKTAAASLSVAFASDLAAVPVSSVGLVAPINGQNTLNAPGSVSAKIQGGGSYYLTLSTVTTLGATANTMASCTTAVGSQVVAYTGTAPQLGQLVVGTGIVPGSYVLSTIPGTSFTLNLPATAAGTVTLNITAGSFAAVVEASTDNGSTWNARNVIPRGYLFAAVSTASLVAPGLYRYSAGPGETDVRVRIAAIGLTGVLGNATAHAVRVNIDSAEKAGGAVAIPYVSYLAATASTFPTGLPFIMPIDMTGMGFASAGIVALTGTGQTITWQQSGDDTGAQRNGLPHMTTSAAQAAAALTTTAPGEYLLAPSQRYLSAFFNAGTMVGTIAIGGVWGSLGASLPQTICLNTINNQPMAITQVGGATMGAHSAAMAGNPIPVSGRVNSTLDTTLTNNDASYLGMTTAQQLMTKDFATSENDWQSTGTQTTNTATAAKTAGAASIRNFCTQLTVQNTNATPTTFLILDNATTIFQISLPASMTLPLTFVFPTPLKGTAATAMNINCGTTGANVLYNITGYQSF